MPLDRPILRPNTERDLTEPDIQSSGDAQLLAAITWLKEPKK